MTKMTKTQRTAILRQHNDRNHGNSIIANARTIAVLVREGWAVHPMHVSPVVARLGKVRTAYVTPAGLRAAGVNLDKLHAKALADWTVRDDDPRDDAVRAEATRYNMRGGRGDARLWAVGIVREAAHREALEVDAMCCTLNPIGHAARECPGSVLNRAHAEALTEYREVTRAARKADADAYQRELARSVGLKVKGDPIANQEERDQHSSDYWESATAGMPGWVPAFG